MGGAGRTYAVIIAGGVGSRMGADIPKQFVEVYGRPVLGYTLESFQRHADVDEIVVVCIEGWEGAVEGYAGRHGIGKLSAIVPGGGTGQESIRNGVLSLEGRAGPDDIVVIHDGVRPMVDREVLADVVAVAREKGNAVTSLPYNEQIFVVDGDDPATTTQFIPRETLRRVSTPQAYTYEDLKAAYQEAFERGIGIHGSHYTNTMMVELGRTLHFAKGSERNIKLTTPEDIETFKAYLAQSEGDWF